MLEERIDRILQLPGLLEIHVCKLYSDLDLFEWKKEIAPLLELALWKVALADRFHKKTRIYVDVSHRVQCRVQCGADIVIRNVFNFIGSDSVSIPSGQPDFGGPHFDEDGIIDY